MPRTPSPDVIQAAQAADKKWGVFASVSLAQWALESAWGLKATGAYNFFGIKAAPWQLGVDCYTHEVVNGKTIAMRCKFRSFPSMEAAFDEHARLIASEKQYEAAMAHKNDLAAFVMNMAKVYATDPAYGPKLLTLIHDEGFTKYDRPTLEEGHE